MPSLATGCGWSWRVGGQGPWIDVPLCGLLAGRGRRCDLVLDAPEVSRRHLRIAPLGEGLLLLDLPSDRRRRILAEEEEVVGPFLLGLRPRVGEEPLPAGIREAWDAPDEEGLARLMAWRGPARRVGEGAWEPAWPQDDEAGPLRRVLGEALGIRSRG